MIKPKRTEQIYKVIGFFVAYLLIYYIVHFTPKANLTQPSANSYARLGITAIIPSIFVCFFQQGFAEEILFRGFIECMPLGYEK